MRRTLAIVTLALASGHALGQDETSPSPEENARSVLDDAPILSPRAAGMGGAVSTVADDMDALFTNPAGIGGLGWGKRDVPWVRKLYFPWFGAATNENSRELIGDFRGSDAQDDDAVGKAILDAHAGERQYARATAATGMVFGRTMVAPYYDNQIAATAAGDGTNLIEMRHRATSGVAYGWSAQDTEGRFALGYSGYTASRTETFGSFAYDDMIVKETRSELLDAATHKYSATGHNAGLVWRLGKTAAPTLGVYARDLGDTKYNVTKASETAVTPPEDVVVKQNVTAGFSLTPQLGRSSRLTLQLEAARIEDPDVELAKKFRVGLELTAFGAGAGSYALVGLRAGYDAAGVSAGTSLNLGLIVLEAALQSVDIGIGNEKVVERRLLGTIYVNVAEF